MKNKRPSCDDYMRMPLSQEVIDHIRSCEDCPRYSTHLQTR